MHTYIEGSLPALPAGSDINLIPSTSDRFRLIALYAKLTTSSTAASRQVALSLSGPSGATLFAKGVVSTQAADLTYAYSWSSGSGPAQGGSTEADSIVSDGVPDWWVPSRTAIGTKTAEMAAGDQWSDGFYVVEVSDWRGRARVEELLTEALG